MSATLKDAFKAAEKLSPEDQKTLAAEMEKRAYELWLDAEIQKGVKSFEEEGGIPAEEVFERLRNRLKNEYGV